MDKNNNKIDGLVDKAVNNLKSLADTNLIVGESVKDEFGDTIIPISKMTVGYIAGGGEYGVSKKRHRYNENYPFGGATGAGCTVTPIGFLVVNKNKVHFVSTNTDDAVGKLLELAKMFVSKIKG